MWRVRCERLWLLVFLAWASNRRGWRWGRWWAWGRRSNICRWISFSGGEFTGGEYGGEYGGEWTNKYIGEYIAMYSMSWWAFRVGSNEWVYPLCHLWQCSDWNALHLNLNRLEPGSTPGGQIHIISHQIPNTMLLKEDQKLNSIAGSHPGAQPGLPAAAGRGREAEERWLFLFHI